MLRGGSFAADVFGVRRVVGMGGVFARVFLVGQFLVGQFVMGEFFVGGLFVGGFFMSFRAAQFAYTRRLER